MPMTSSKLQQVGALWALALAMSVVLVAAGDRWPGPLPIQPSLVAALLLGPPLLMALWLLLRWRLPADPQGGGTHQGTESVETARERH
jgi:hypothetical protein